MNYVTFCKNYYAVTGIPTNLITEAGAIYSALSEQLHISTESPYPLYPSDYNPEFRFASPDIVYGSVQIEATGEYIILGPVFSVPVTDELVRSYMLYFSVYSVNLFYELSFKFQKIFSR